MILVTGGAGYIGSHVTKDLLNKGYSVLVLDNLSTGHMEAIDKRATFMFGDIGDEKLLDQIFQTFSIKAVMHFSANCLVAESVDKPLKYYENNVGKTIHFITKLIKYNINNFIFSSSCATYGIPSQPILTENHPTNPINPYGKSKLMVESILQDVSCSHSLNYVILRYFNAGGADVTGTIGEDHNPETHLIPNILKHLQNKTPFIEVFGRDYPTPDGTCVRDYIHVSDLSNAHILALEYLRDNQDKRITEIFNLGNERGYSVLEVIKMCETVTNRKVNLKFQDRREGDPPHLVASSKKIKEILGWTAKYNLEQIIHSSWNWHQNYPDGF